MATDYGLPWRIALIGLLAGDAELTTLLGGPNKIFDNVPQDTATPYIRLGDDLVADYGDKSDPGQEFTSSIHIFDGSPTQRGQERINRIQARVYALLHECAPITVGDRQTYLVRFIDRITRNLDGTNWHGIDRFRVLI